MGSLHPTEANTGRSAHRKIFYCEAELLQRLMDSLARPTHIYEGRKLPPQLGRGSAAITFYG